MATKDVTKHAKQQYRENEPLTAEKLALWSDILEHYCSAKPREKANETLRLPAAVKHCFEIM